MSAAIGSLLALAGVIVTATVSLIVGLRAGKTDAKSKEDQREINLIDRYMAEISRIDKLLADQRDTITTLSGSNQKLSAQVEGLRVELEEMRERHHADLSRIEGKLNSARSYIRSLHEWVKRKVEDQHLTDTEGFPMPPDEIDLDGVPIPIAVTVIAEKKENDE